MTKKKTLILIIILAVCIISCQKQPDNNIDNNKEVQSVQLVLEECNSDETDTKTTYESITGGFIFNWAEGDIVGIITAEGNQLKFPIKSEYYGLSHAEFDGRGFALVSGEEYYSYYPFIPDYDINLTAVPISYEGQYQTGNDDATKLGAYAYCLASGSAPSQGTLVFSYKNVGSPHIYRIPCLAASYSRLTLTAPDSRFVINGTLDLTAETVEELIAITPVSQSSEMQLDLINTSMTEPGRLTCRLMVPPVDLSDGILRLTLTMADGSSIIASVPGRECPANTRRTSNAVTAVYPGEQIIASDGGDIVIKLIKTAESNAVTISSVSPWLSQKSSTIEGLVTTYVFTASENTGDARVGEVSFTETETGMVNTVKINQGKAGTIIGIGGWDSENHQGTAN